jgi:hypothetical protein
LKSGYLAYTTMILRRTLDVMKTSNIVSDRFICCPCLAT